MMSSENIPPAVHPPDYDHTTNNNTIARKSTTPKTQEQPVLKCPRCDSSNTKFCYYNNYSLTQPRHFCKTCRRYWTKGGALRNVPIGGGCRKTKKHKPSSSTSSCPTSSRFDLSTGPGGSEFKFLAPPTVTPAMEFQLGGLSLPRLHPATAGVYTQFIASSGAHHQPVGIGPGTGGCFSLDLLGINNYPTIPNSGNSSSSSSSSLSLAGGGGGGGGDHTISISSIESLSSINQEMHWKLQQQRLALIYGPTTVEEDHHNNHQEKSLGGEISLFKKLDVGGSTPTEWLFEQIQTNSSANYDHHNNHNNNTSLGVTATTTNCHNNNNHEDFNGIWTTDLHHQQQQQQQQHQQQQHHQFNGLQ